jgi:hypothetical protein
MNMNMCEVPVCELVHIRVHCGNMKMTVNVTMIIMITIMIMMLDTDMDMDKVRKHIHVDLLKVYDHILVHVDVDVDFSSYFFIFMLMLTLFFLIGTKNSKYFAVCAIEKRSKLLTKWCTYILNNTGGRAYPINPVQ